MRIAFLGTGLMGTGFVTRMLAQGHEVTVWNRTPGKTGALELERTVERVRSCGVLRQPRGAELSAELAKVK